MKFTGTRPDIQVLYEDNHLLALNKPAGLLSQEDSSGDVDILTLGREYLRREYNKSGNVFLGLLHRLDRPTGGVMLFAKTSKAAARMSALIRQREIQKRYLAVVEGTPPGNGLFSHYLCKDREANRVSVCREGVPGAKKAELTFFTGEQKKNLSLVTISLITGRAHQIRVQFSHEGYPLAGDSKYGRKSDHPIALFAHQLIFTHPVKQKKITITAPLPDGRPWNLFSR